MWGFGFRRFRGLGFKLSRFLGRSSNLEFCFGFRVRFQRVWGGDFEVLGF